MATRTLDVEVEDHVHDAVLRVCERLGITLDQLVSDHLRSLIAASDDRDPQSTD